MHEFTIFSIDDFKKIKSYLDTLPDELVKSGTIEEPSDKIRELVHEKFAITNNVNEIYEYYKVNSAPYIDYLASNYKYYYAFSDIHADLISFFMTLIQNDIIGFYDNDVKIDKNDIITNCITRYSKINILEEYLCKYKLKLLISNAIIFVLGDVIDGSRNGRQIINQTKFDELIIHAILYNIRILGKDVNSKLVITLGNHDYFSFFTSERLMDPYIDCQTLTYFGQVQRKQILGSFYLFDASFFEIIKKDDKILGILCHGSFSMMDNLFEDVNLENLIELKKRASQFLFDLVYKKGDIVVENIELNDTSIKKLSVEQVVLNITQSRRIPLDLGTSIGTTCENIKNYISDNGFMVIGHCITGQYISQFGKFDGIDSDCKTRTNKSKHDCISVNCIFNKIPKIIMVDNAWASHNSSENAGKYNEPVLCEHSSEQITVSLGPPTFTEMLLLKTNNTESCFDFYIIRSLFQKKKSIYYKILVDSNVYVPNRIVFEKNKIIDLVDVKLGGFYKKYMKYKLKYTLLKKVT